MMKYMRIPKINTVHYGWIWIASGLLVGAIVPYILWLIFHRLFIIPIIVGGVILLAFIIVFCIEMHQDNSKVPFYEKTLKDEIKYDPDTQYAVIKSSICTGEKVAGFKNKKDGHFVEVMVIRTSEDEKRFMAIYGLDEVRTEY